MEEDIFSISKQTEKIEKMLLKFTDNFSGEDVEFIRMLVFPTTVTVRDLAATSDSDPDYDGITKYEVITLFPPSREGEDQLSLWKVLNKKLPEECIVEIAQSKRKMILESRIVSENKREVI